MSKAKILVSLILLPAQLHCSHKSAIPQIPILPIDIYWAAHNCTNAEIVKEYVSKSPQHANSRNRYGSLLTVAAYSNNTAILKVAAEKKADLNQKPTGLTPLQIAAFNGHEEAVQILIDSGAKTDIETSEGETALSLAEKRLKDLPLDTEKTKNYENIIIKLSPKKSSIKL